MTFLRIVFLSIVLCGSSQAFAQSHSYIAMMRSSTENHVFVSQSVEGMYGNFTLGHKEAPASKATAAVSYGAPAAEQQLWQGYTIRTSVGLEVFKFIQFSVGHGFVSLRSKDHSFENLRGSQLTGEGKLVFISPVGNLEAGGGVIGSRYDYQRKLEDAAFYGSGMYYTLGWNYFMNSQVSVFGNAKVQQEHLSQNAGSSSISDIDTYLTSLGFGFSIWL